MKRLSLVAIATLLVVIALISFISCAKIPNNADDAAAVFKDNECEVTVLNAQERKEFADRLFDEQSILIVGDFNGYVVATKGELKAEIFYLQLESDMQSIENFYNCDIKDKVTYTSNTIDSCMIFIGSKELYNLFK